MRETDCDHQNKDQKTHREPDCHRVKGCSYAEPHRHGFDCDKSCTECHGYCHPACPAFK